MGVAGSLERDTDYPVSVSRALYWPAALFCLCACPVRGEPTTVPAPAAPPAERALDTKPKTPQVDQLEARTANPSSAPADTRSDIGPATTPLLEEHRRIFWSSIEDHPAVIRGGVTQARKGKHYLAGNEKTLFAFREAIDGVGGGYVGVGSDQAYLLMGWSRPRLAWLVDYDPDVIRIHRVYRAFFLAFDAPEELVAAFSDEGRDAAVRAIEALYPPDEALELRRLYMRHRAWIARRLEAQVKRLQTLGLPGVYVSQPDYDHVRALLQNERVRPMVVNLLDEQGLAGVGEVARQLEVPIRVLYLSNAEEYWDDYPPSFRRNVGALPRDDRSLVLRTLLTWDINRDYRYGIQPLDNFVEWLSSPDVHRVYRIVRGRPDAIAGRVNVFRTDAPPPSAAASSSEAAQRNPK